MRRACAAAARAAPSNPLPAAQRRWISGEETWARHTPVFSPVLGHPLANVKKLDLETSTRMGRTALVVGGTGLLGKGVCQELVGRHVKTFSLSRRGGLEVTEMTERLDLMDEVHWVEGDASDEEIWNALDELVRDLNEVVICLPRTLEGARTAEYTVQMLYRLKAFPYNITLVSLPHFWPQVDKDTRHAWMQAEAALAGLYPDDYMIVRPGEMYTGDQLTFTADLRRKFRKFVHKRLLKDDIDSLSNLSALYLAVNRFKETERSARWIPPVDVADVAIACLSTKLPDLMGGVVRELSTFEIATLRFRAIPTHGKAKGVSLENFY